MVTKELEQDKDIPYTVIGPSVIPENFDLVLTGKGVKEIAKKMRDEDSLRITLYPGTKATTFEIIMKKVNER